MRIVVTGASGFIGQAVAGALGEVPGTRVSRWSRTPAAGIVPVPMHDTRAISDRLNVDDPDVIIHCAAPASVSDAQLAPRDDLYRTIDPLVALLEASSQRPVQPRIILVSSAAVYGAPRTMPITEATELRPISAYGYHKVIAEELCREYASVRSMDICIARLFSCFGARQRRLLVWELAAQVLRGAPAVVLNGTGREVRDYLDARTVAQYICGIASLDATGMPGSVRIINLASGRSTTTLEIANMISRIGELPDPPKLMGKKSETDPAEWRVDVTVASGVVGTAPFDLEAALQACLIEWGVSGVREA